VLIVDAEPVFVAGVSAVLARVGLDVQPVDPGVLAGAAGPDLADEGDDRPAAPPGVLILDSALGGTAGLASMVRAAQSQWPAAQLVLILRRERQEGLLDLLGAGVRALLHRRCEPEELVAAVQAAGSGRTWVASVLAGSIRAQSQAERAGDRSAVLSARELDVLRRMATGATNMAIGRTLGISENTVRNHVHAILTKLGATNRTDAVALAAQRGIVEMSG
jgi:DNA-binding NarL/FixJ family response regulator